MVKMQISWTQYKMQHLFFFFMFLKWWAGEQHWYSRLWMLKVPTTLVQKKKSQEGTAKLCEVN